MDGWFLGCLFPKHGKPGNRLPYLAITRLRVANAANGIGGAEYRRAAILQGWWSTRNCCGAFFGSRARRWAPSWNRGSLLFASLAAIVVSFLPSRANASTTRVGDSSVRSRPWDLNSPSWVEASPGSSHGGPHLSARRRFSLTRRSFAR